MELNEYLESPTSPDYFFLWEVASNSISYFSPSFYQLKVDNLSKEEIVKELIHPDSVEYFGLMLEKLQDLNYRIDEEIKGNSEKYGIGWLRLKTFPFYHENVVYKVAIQFTLLKKQKKKLPELNKQGQAEEGMLEAVTQDLWGAISNIISFAKIMDSERKESRYTDFEHYIGNIIKIGFETREVLATVLELKEFENGHQSLNLEKLALPSFLNNVALSLKPKFMEYGINIQVHSPAEPMLAQLDKKRFAQVFGNIVSNLAKSTRPGGTIDFYIEKLQHKILIKITNCQTGALPASKPNFPKYFIEPEHDIENASGLEITRKIIELHKGEIWVERKKGLCAVFFIELPES